jgi:isocitrate dehydrogenase kinase/phosphatase
MANPTGTQAIAVTSVTVTAAEPLAAMAALQAGIASMDAAPMIAERMIEGFDKHYRLFRESSAGARQRFDDGDWPGVQRAVKERIQFFDARVQETVERLGREFRADELDHRTWQQVKLEYIGLLTQHKQPELAETFFNSVSCKILHRTFFHNDFIFFRPAVSVEYIESDPPSYRSYYPVWAEMAGTFRKILLDFGWARPFLDIGRDAERIATSIEAHLGGWPQRETNLQIQVLHAAFYRNKAAYVIGKIVNGHQEFPFAIPVLHDGDGRLVPDTILLDAWRIGLMFSLNHAYFMVDMEVPSAYVAFLRSIMPWKSRAELYTMLGLQKQGKNHFYRDLMQHLRHSRDQFIIAPGIRGLVMEVFTLPSFPYVFKVIRDHIAPPKDTDRATVKSKYLLVKRHDRVGRMADTLEFSDVALPRERCSDELIEALKRTAPSLIEEEGDIVIIKHLYIERRMQPLNLFLDAATPEQVEHAVRDYGNAIRELALANIFPGDMMFKNFGITRYGRVVFYDYDEIEYMTDCSFRRIPEPPNPDFEMSGEVWYPVGRNDVFPEEFGAFLLSSPMTREAFLRYHADLLTPEFWQQAQVRIRTGQYDDFFPYPEFIRFQNAFGPGGRGALQVALPEANAPRLGVDLRAAVERD